MHLLHEDAKRSKSSITKSTDKISKLSIETRVYQLIVFQFFYCNPWLSSQRIFIRVSKNWRLLFWEIEHKMISKQVKSYFLSIHSPAPRVYRSLLPESRKLCLNWFQQAQSVKTANNSHPAVNWSKSTIETL